MPEDTMTVAQALETMAEEGQDAGTGEPGATEATAEQGTGVNWDDEGNPYRQRYTGLQGNFKQVHGELQQTKAQMAQMVEEMAAMKAQADGLSDADIQQVRAGVRGQFQQQETAAQIAAQRAELVAFARVQGVQQIAEHFGVDTELLMPLAVRTEDPREVVVLAQRLQLKARSGNLQARKEQGVDRVEGGGGGGGARWDSMNPSELIMAGVRAEAKKK